ncbi:formate dehydrogenase [Ramlibacter humi]|uniref:Formate dehydrogenase n=1 Tax=Ramlibacter humi TaxID=2530451 RepID=A0A4Z0C146_9BURK|nr:formate dehydrogenase [Ramlibacter humi]TFZ03959.1 formate dehydrogenase [Ramlibacter humi]
MGSPASKLSRRTLFAGAAATGAVAAAAGLAAASREAAPQQATDLPKPPPERGGGYELSEHVQRYYQTTRV